MWTLLFLCSVLTTHGVEGFDSGPSGGIDAQKPDVSADSAKNGSARASCRYNCGDHLGSCSCTSYCQTYGSCCHDYHYYCQASTAEPAITTSETPQPSCRYNCGSHMGSCSCSSNCQYYGRCCHDYHYYCPTSTPQTDTTAQPSCRYNCGSHLGSCSCSSDCQYYGSCCHDYNYYCPTSTPETETSSNATPQPSCRYNCGSHMGSCSCSSNCQYYGRCCHDYHYYCPTSTPQTDTTAQPSCRYNCGSHLGSCSCSSDCQYYGSCCHDYNYYCPTSTPQTETSSNATPQPSCRYNCGYHLGSCSCSSDCQYYGSCCHDYHYYCQASTAEPETPTSETHQPSCRYNCGYHLGSCSCSSNCQYYGSCCHDYHYYCPTSTPETETSSNTTPQPSCRYNCGSHLGSCSCSSDCQYYGSCCHDYHYYCPTSTPETETSSNTTPQPSCRYNCGSHLGSCSCSSDCQYYGTCCHGYHFYCTSTTEPTSPPGQVNCSSDTMIIEIEKSYLASLGYTGSELYLNDQYCRPTFHFSKVVFTFPADSCGNNKQFEDGKVVYTNSLRAYKNSTSGEITRERAHLKLNIYCIMDEDSVSQNMFVVQYPANDTIVGQGKFNTNMTFYTSSSFYFPVTEYPYEIELNESLYVEVNLPGGDSSLVIFLDTCVASPSATDFHTRVHYLVRNGCTADNTYYAYVTGTQHFARFRVKTFQFLRASDSVYLQCTVVICQASESNSRCRRGCRRRKARDLGSEHDRQTLVLGPIKLKDPMQKEEEVGKQEVV